MIDIIPPNRFVGLHSHYPTSDKWQARELYKKLGWLGKKDGLTLPEFEDLKCELYPKNATQMWDEFLSAYPVYDFYKGNEELVRDAINRTHQTKQNYLWHVDLCEALCKEYTRRYNKIHKSEQYVLWFRNNLPLNIKDDVLQDFPICMKDEYKISKDPVVCYKFYYIKDKSRFAKWKYTSVPSWYSKGLEKLNSSISCSSDKDEKPK